MALAEQFIGQEDLHPIDLVERYSPMERDLINGMRVPRIR